MAITPSIFSRASSVCAQSGWSLGVCFNISLTNKPKGRKEWGIQKMIEI